MKVRTLLLSILFLSISASAWGQNTPQLKPVKPLVSQEKDASETYKLSAEGLSLLQFISVPVGLGYFYQNETEAGIRYSALQLGGLTAGAILTEFSGSGSASSLLGPLQLGLWIRSLADVWALSKQKSGKIYPSQPEEWQSSFGASMTWLTFDKKANMTVSPTVNLSYQYPLGDWAKWEGISIPIALKMQVGSFAVLPLNQSSVQTQFSAPGMRTGIGLSYKQNLLYGDLDWAWMFETQYREVLAQNITQELQSVAYKGGSLSAIWRLPLFSNVDLHLGLSLRALNPSTPNDKKNIGIQLSAQPEIGLGGYF